MSAAPAVELRDVCKSYVAGTPVLRDVDLVVPHGTITALVGANGSGKSTMVRILSGFHHADAGSQILIAGHDVGAQVTPEIVRTAGLRFVHQDSGLVPGISVIDNMLVGRYRTGFAGRVRWKEERRDVRALLDRWGIRADLDEDAGDLPLPTIAKLAVLRALRTEQDEVLNAVILDEPTATLGYQDAAELLSWLRDLATRQNVGVLFISHRLDEVFEVADRIAVLRGGRIVANRPAHGFDHDGLVEEIIGGKLERFYPGHGDRPADEVGLAVRELRGARVHGISFEMRAGEVVGVTGLPGSGFEDVPYLLTDPELRPRGAALLTGSPLQLGTESIRARARRGLVLVPGDRKRKALVSDLTVRENLTLPRLRSFVRRGLLSRKRERRDAESLILRFGIKASSSETSAGQLSGGNQQKIVLAKWLATAPAVLLVHEPTHGVDVGAKSEIFALIAGTVARGTAVLVASVEYEDLAHLCDRVLVLAQGRICAELSGSGLTAEAITAAAFTVETPVGTAGVLA